MSDIFISYAREDRAVAEALANDLKARGYRVWWDAELVGSDDYYDVILQALHDAKAAIVIWTKAAVRSRFLRDEARLALHLGKLVATKDAELDTLQIPFGFQSQHTDDILDRTQIFKALEKLGVKSAVSTSPLPGVGIAELDRVDEIVAYLGTSPPEAQRQAALARLKALTSRPDLAKGASSIVSLTRTSNWQAFWLGLTLRLPQFQLEGRGMWTAFGVGLALFVLYSLAFVGGSAAIVDLANSMDPSSKGTFVRNFCLVALWLILCFVAWRHFGQLVDQRNFSAATFIAMFYMAAGVFTSYMTGQLVADQAYPPEPDVVLRGLVRYSGEHFVTSVVVFGMLASVVIVSAFWRIRAAR